MNVYSKCRHVAQIARQHPAADGFNSAEPWLLLHNTGRVDKFAQYREARAEAVKTYPSVRFDRDCIA